MRRMFRLVTLLNVPSPRNFKPFHRRVISCSNPWKVKFRRSSILLPPRLKSRLTLLFLVRTTFGTMDSLDELREIFLGRCTVVSVHGNAFGGIIVYYLVAPDSVDVERLLPGNQELFQETYLKI